MSVVIVLRKVRLVSLSITFAIATGNWPEAGLMLGFC